MAISPGAVGSQIRVLRGILSGLEARSSDLLFPRLLQPVSGAPARGYIKTITAGQMLDGGSVDAFKVAPGATIPRVDPLQFGEVQYGCTYRKLHDVVPKEDARADEELPAPIVEFRGRNLMSQLLMNRDYALIHLLESTVWGQVTNLAANAGAEQFDNDDAEPITTLANAVDAQPMQPNVLVFGATAWHRFRLHPNVLSALSITRDRAMVDEQTFAQIIGQHLGISRVVVYNLRVNTGGPVATVTTGNLTRRFAKKIWLGTVDDVPSTVNTNPRGEIEVLTNPTAIKAVVEDPLDYEEERVINPQGRQMTCSMSYDIKAITAALGCRLDNVVS